MPSKYRNYRRFVDSVHGTNVSLLDGDLPDDVAKHFTWWEKHSCRTKTWWLQEKFKKGRHAQPHVDWSKYENLQTVSAAPSKRAWSSSSVTITKQQTQAQAANSVQEFNVYYIVDKRKLANGEYEYLVIGLDMNKTRTRGSK